MQGTVFTHCGFLNPNLQEGTDHIYLPKVKFVSPALCSKLFIHFIYVVMPDHSAKVNSTQLIPSSEAMLWVHIPMSSICHAGWMGSKAYLRKSLRRQC